MATIPLFLSFTLLFRWDRSPSSNVCTASVHGNANQDVAYIFCLPGDREVLYVVKLLQDFDAGPF